MKRWLMLLILFAASLALLVSCNNGKEVGQTTDSGKTEEMGEQKDIDDYVLIKEEVNREDVTPNGERARYIYQVPFIQLDKPGADKINQRFLDIEKDMESRIGDGQNVTTQIHAKAFLNDDIISMVMEVFIPTSDGIHVANYDMASDKEISTKELIEKYNFAPEKLIDAINQQGAINEDILVEEQMAAGINDFVRTIIHYQELSPDDYGKRIEEMEQKTDKEKEKFVIENIDKLKAFLNEEGDFVFIYIGALQDEELVVQ